MDEKISTLIDHQATMQAQILRLQREVTLALFAMLALGVMFSVAIGKLKLDLGGLGGAAD
jgi:hypothetical protein